MGVNSPEVKIKRIPNACWTILNALQCSPVCAALMGTIVH